MAQINLLPWREELRKRRQKEFGITAGVAVVLMLGVIGAVHWHYQSRIEFQDKRNAFLNKEIKQLDKQIKEIRNLKKQRQRLLARTEKIQQLQSGRPEIVHLVDELVKTLPEGVYYTKVAQKGNRLALQGVAQSNARVSSLMRRLDGSEWMQNPRLLQIAAAGRVRGGAGVRNSTFSLNIRQTNKAKQKAAAEAKANKGKKRRKGAKSS